MDHTGLLRRAARGKHYSLRVTPQFQQATYRRVLVYEKPALQRFGTLRYLTLIGLGPDGDGGIWGLGWIDGQSFYPKTNSRS